MISAFNTPGMARKGGAILARASAANSAMVLPGSLSAYVTT